MRRRGGCACAVLLLAALLLPAFSALGEPRDILTYTERHPEAQVTESPQKEESYYEREREDLDLDTLMRIALFSAMTKEIVQSETVLTIDPSRPMVALTFDDGPGENTTRIAELVYQYGGRATFFMVGNRVKNYREVVEQVAAYGHEIGTHTWSHPELTEVSRGEVEAQLTRSADLLREVSGQAVSLMRPPYGSNDETVRDVCRALGLPLIHWSVDTEDWRTRSASATYDAIFKDVRDGSIILCHDIVPSTLEAMEYVVPELIRQGYQLVTVSELMHFRGIEPKAGKVYYQIGD